MDEESVLARLPEAYAAALRLRGQGLDEEAIAAQLELEPQAVGPLLRLAKAKLVVWGKETRFACDGVLAMMAGAVQTGRLADLFAVSAALRFRSSARSPRR
jgi:hypothetical protein